jgi:hypothetical protein
MEQPLAKKQHLNTDDTVIDASVPFKFDYLATHPTTWDPNSLKIPLNIRLDGCIVPSETAPESARISYSHIIVLDGLVDDATRKAIQNILLDSVVDGTNKSDFRDSVRHLPSDKWERKTADMAGAAPTWGLRPHLLETFLGAGGGEQDEGNKEEGGTSSIPEALLEIQGRLVKLYPEYHIAYLPSQAIQNQQESESDQEEENDLNEDTATASKRIKLNRGEVEVSKTKHNGSSVDCSAILANAAAHGDTFRYHVDADPTSFPPSTWTRTFGEYFNGEPGKPLLVTLLIYIDDKWERDYGGETFFLDGTTDTGIFVRPKPGRAILMEQDVVHKVNPPSTLADGRLRLSLVYKLVFLPKNLNLLGNNLNSVGGGGEVRLARKEWGQPTSFGSAARVDAVKRQLLAEKNIKKRVKV